TSMSSGGIHPIAYNDSKPTCELTHTHGRIRDRYSACIKCDATGRAVSAYRELLRTTAMQFTGVQTLEAFSVLGSKLAEQAARILGSLAETHYSHNIHIDAEAGVFD